MTEVSWRGHTVPVKNEKVRSFILHAQQSTRELDRAETMDSKLTLYDSLLMECKDALQAIKDELKGDTVSTSFLLFLLTCEYAKRKTSCSIWCKISLNRSLARSLYQL